MVLIGLVYKCFIDNLYNFPNRLIHVCKQDVSNIEFIDFGHEYSEANLTSSSTIDLSKLVNLYIHNGESKDSRESAKINLEGLYSLERLHLGANSKEMSFSIRNLHSLETLSILISCTIDENLLTQLLEQLSHVENLFLRGNFSHFNLDSLVNLKLLSLEGTINESFNIELLKNLCDRIEVIKIELTNIEDKTLFKMFDGYSFPNLIVLSILKCNLKRLKKEYFNPFPELYYLFIIDCNLEVIEADAFSNLKHLQCLDLSRNRLKFIEKNTFSNLENLETLDFCSNNDLKNLDAEFIGIENSVKILLENENVSAFYRLWYNNINNA